MSATTMPMSASRAATSFGLLHLVLAGLCLIPFSPLAAWIVLAMAGVFCGRSHQQVRRVLGLGIILCGALSYASRETSGVANDDFYYTYYPTFLTIEHDGLGAFLRRYLESFGTTMGPSVVELGFYTWLYIIGLLFGQVSIATVIFLTTAAIAVLYWAWLERYFLRELPSARHGLVMVVSLTLFSYGLCSQLSRQMFSIPFVLAGIWESRTRRSGLWILAGAFFHLSALPIGLFGWSVRRWPRICIGALMVMLVLAIAQPSMINTLGAAIAFDKFAYYTGGFAGDATGFDSRYLLVGLAPGLLGVLAVVNGQRIIGHLMIGASLIYVLLLPLPLASYRATLFVTGALLGPGLAAAFTRRLGRDLFAVFVLAVVLAMLSRRAEVREAGDGMPLWQKFPRADVVPFYYVPEIRK